MYRAVKNITKLIVLTSIQARTSVNTFAIKALLVLQVQVTRTARPPELTVLTSSTTVMNKGIPNVAEMRVVVTKIV